MSVWIHKMTDSFENLLINIDELPQVEQEEFTPIEQAYLKVVRIGYAFFYAIFLIVPQVILFFNEEHSGQMDLHLYFALAPILFWFINFFLTKAAFVKKKYALRSKDIIYKKGLIWSKRISIPFNRIQHAEVKQGPIERIYKLHNLKIFTAGGSSSDLSIPGLTEDNALKLKNFILNKVEEDGSEH